MSKMSIKKLLIHIAFIFYLSGCAEGGGGSSGSSDLGISILPKGDGTALVSWTPPTENTDGSTLTDLAGYKVYYGTSPGSYGSSITINGTGISSYLVENLGIAEWYFVMTSFNSSGIESSYSPIVSKTITN